MYEYDIEEVHRFMGNLRILGFHTY